MLYNIITGTDCSYDGSVNKLDNLTWEITWDTPFVLHYVDVILVKCMYKEVNYADQDIRDSATPSFPYKRK